MSIEIDLGDNFIDESCEEERAWLIDDVLNGGNLILMEQSEIGDYISKVKVTDLQQITTI